MTAKTQKKQLTKEQKDFQKAFNNFSRSIDNSARLLKKMENTGNPDERAKLMPELKKWGAEYQKAIEAMEQALGHH